MYSIGIRYYWLLKNLQLHILLWIYKDYRLKTIKEKDPYKDNRSKLREDRLLLTMHCTKITCTIV